MQELAAQEPPAISSRSLSDDERYTTSQCYELTSTSLNEVTAKSVEGNEKCEKIANTAESQAEADMESDRKALDSQNTKIQGDLQTCQSNADATPEDALSCYEEQVSKILVWKE